MPAKFHIVPEKNFLENSWTQHQQQQPASTSNDAHHFTFLGKTRQGEDWFNLLILPISASERDLTSVQHNPSVSLHCLSFSLWRGSSTAPATTLRCLSNPIRNDDHSGFRYSGPLTRSSCNVSFTPRASINLLIQEASIFQRWLSAQTHWTE